MKKVIIIALLLGGCSAVVDMTPDTNPTNSWAGVKYPPPIPRDQQRDAPRVMPITQPEPGLSPNPDYPVKAIQGLTPRNM